MVVCVPLRGAFLRTLVPSLIIFPNRFQDFLQHNLGGLLTQPWHTVYPWLAVPIDRMFGELPMQSHSMPGYPAGVLRS